MTSLIDIENCIFGCLFEKPDLIKELYIDDKCFVSENSNKKIKFLRKCYEIDKTLDIGLMTNKFTNDKSKNDFINWYSDIYASGYYILGNFYKYQEQLQENYRSSSLESQIQLFSDGKLDMEQLIEKINQIQNENLYLKTKVNKDTPNDFVGEIRKEDRQIQFTRLTSFNTKISINENTVNIIAARPSEGKSALALNMMCDLAKKYKCVYFNMEMTKSEVYERMIGIEAGIPIKHIRHPQSDYQDKQVYETATKIFNWKYEIVNGSKNLSSLRSKIIKEQRDEHLIVFIDYVGYITLRSGMSETERIGEITRELNNLTKDYDCTIFLIAQINRNGAEQPTMEDLKSSGELEQSADTIILIHDPNKNDTADEKVINLLIPKCRSSKRNIAIKIKYLKDKQRMEDYNERY
jgi:replicative DNA helicase